tara:strand:+ start:43 stop:705 length:663 start_codon:yes stop_codon:yes gene_type:complete
MTKSDKNKTYIDYSFLNIEDVLSFGVKKINNLKNITKLNQLSFIKVDRNFIYHMRQLNQKEKDNTFPKWFVYNPEDLFSLFIFRIWQNFDFKKRDFGIDDFFNYKENILVDIYGIKESLNLVKYKGGCYSQLDNFLYCLDNEYKPSDDFDMANWIQNNKNILKVDGWLEEFEDKNKQGKRREIDEIMIIPSSSNKLEFIETTKIEKIIDMDRKKFFEILK